MQTIDQLRDLLGEDKTQALLRRSPVDALYVPMRPPHEGHWLWQILGDDVLGLTQIFGGDTLHLPRQRAARKLRNQAICTRYADGESASKLARWFGITERSVRRIVSEA